jgi:hypothetical protein
MTFNKRINRLESGLNDPTSPNDEVVWIDTENDTIKRYNKETSSWVTISSTEGGNGGGEPLSVSNPPAGNGPEGPLPLDLTKSVHRLNGPGDEDALYSLADGAEGQIIYLVPNTNTYYLTAVVIVQSARILGDDAFSTATLYTNSDFRPFLNSTDASAQSVVTLIFTDGAWQSSSGNWGISD